MNKIVLAALGLLAVSTTAHAAGLSVSNNSGLPIDELFASEPGKTAWGANLMAGMPEGSLDSGKTAQVAALADGTYDLRISAPDEAVLCVMSGVVVKDGKIDLTADMGKACK